MYSSSTIVVKYKFNDKQYSSLIAPTINGLQVNVSIEAYM